MSTETFLQFWHAHLNTIIGVLIVSVLALLGVYLFLEFMKEKNQGDGDGQAAANFDQIEDSLKKLLENAQLPVKSAESGADAEVSAEAKKELEELKSLVDEKDALIKKLKEQADSADADGDSGGNSAELESKIQDLEARLMEYEIIEDDIADLSMYKEENVKLKQELEALKVGGGAPAPEREPAVEEASAPVTEEETKEPDAEAASGVDLGDDIMAEFAAAVQEQKKGEVPPVDKGRVPEEEKAAPAEPEQQAAPAEEEPPAQVQAEVEAVEASAPAEQTAEEEDPPLPPDPVAEAAAQIDLDSLTLDTDKMLGEIEELNASIQEDDGSDALAGGIDTDKMLSEAADLNASVSGKDEAEEEKKLAGEFDNFLKES